MHSKLKDERDVVAKESEGEAVVKQMNVDAKEGKQERDIIFLFSILLLT